MAFAVETAGAGKRFGRVWALRDCDIQIPVGCISGLVGANGSGKTTLLRLLAGLSTPTTGNVHVNGRTPHDDGGFLAGVGFLAQEVPLYRRWTAADHLALGTHLNPAWDENLARERLRSLGIPLDRPIATLSGGMRAQVALALALGKRPRVLLLDEPVAALDPLARREFLASIASAMADGDLTIMMSSHLLPDLERVCDHLVVLAAGTPALCGDVEDIGASHKLLTAPAHSGANVGPPHEVIHFDRTAREVSAIVKLGGPVVDPAWEVRDLGLEEIVIAYLGRRPDDPNLTHVELVRGVR
jgi:ABC-2 type transport system ATP-binding protein